MLNTNYTREIIIGQNWISEHQDDSKVAFMLTDAKNPRLTHMERWNVIYEFMRANYPDVNSSVIVGIAYFLEG